MTATETLDAVSRPRPAAPPEAPLDQPPPERLPWGGLLALAVAGFITVLTEALPAGLLPRIGAGLSISEAMAGQMVTVYAIGSLVAAIPLTAATRGWRRRPLLLTAIAGFAVVNTVTAVSTSFALTLGARFLAGVFAGLLWALVAGYAARMAPEHLKGRAIAVAMIGTPIALSLGVPAGAFLGAAVGWRYAFGLMSVLTVILIGWTLWRVPDFPGQAADRRLPLAGVFAMPGVRPVLAGTLTYVLAHNILYTYVAPFVVPAGLGGQVDRVLFVFGAAALAGVWIVGALIDRRLREMTLVSIAAFGAVAVALGLWGASPLAVYVAVAVWGVTYGGAPTLFQTASAQAAGEAADVAQSMIVTAWNIAIAGGGLFGGMLLDKVGAASLPWALLGLLAVALVVVWRARRAGFPAA